MIEKLRALKALIIAVSDRVDAALVSGGNPVRAIGYGAAVVIYLFALAIKAIPDVTFEQAVGDATVAIGLVIYAVEKARSLVTPIAL